MTATCPGTGNLQLGTVQGTTSAHGCTLYTEKVFALCGDTTHYCVIDIQLATATLVANEEMIWGYGTPGSAILAPTDGLYLTLSNAGLILHNLYNTGSDAAVTIAALSAFPVGESRKVTISQNQEGFAVWIDDADPVFGTWPVAIGQAFQSASLPFFMMRRCTGVVSNSALVRVASVVITHSSKVRGFQPWAETQALQGLMGYQGCSGVIGSTYNPGVITTGSSALPTTGAGANTTALVTGLGGVAQLTAAASSATDLIIFSYLVPAAGVSYQARPLVMTGIRLDCMVYGAAVATTPTTLRFEMSVGSTVLTLNQAESASFATATAKAGRRIYVGTMSAPVAAAIGTPFNAPLNLDFTGGPIVINPGTYWQLIAKGIVGTATASQTTIINCQPVVRWG